MDAKDEKLINYILTNINKVIKSGNLNEFKDLIKTIHEIKNKALLQTSFSNAHINIVGLLCERKKKPLLSYLLHQAHVLQHLTSSDAGRQLRDREEAFYKAMCANHFPILEMLYDHWTGDVHWLGHRKEYDTLDVEHLNQLNTLLINAFSKYHEYIEMKQKMDYIMVCNVQSLIDFNDFQRDVYTKLNILKSKLIRWDDEPNNIIRIQETYVLRKIILTILDAYEEHQKKVQADTQSCGQSVLGNSDYYNTYMVYFRKLDSNICLLILDNLHLLKLRLRMPTDSYQKLENKLYQFNYHVTRNWRLYLPRRKKIKSKKIATTYNNAPCSITISDDEIMWSVSKYIIYLERRDFENAVKDFKDELGDINIEDNIIKAGSKLPNEDMNSLRLLPELRDEYSLKRMSQYIGQLYSVDVKNDKYAFLLIERTLQIVGEFLKSTDETAHLKHTTKAALKAEISDKVINDLKHLRNMLCHTKKGKLLKRIDLETSRRDIFEKIREDLLLLKEKIDMVMYIHKPLIEKALVRNSVAIMCERRNELPEIVGGFFPFMIKVLELLFNGFSKEDWELLDRFKLLTKESVNLLFAYTEIVSKRTRANVNIRKKITMKLPFYEDILSYYMDEILVNMTMLSTDTAGDDNPIFVKVKSYWHFIMNLIEFIVVDADIFNEDLLEEAKMIIQNHKEDYTNLVNGMTVVKEYINKIKVDLNIKSTNRTMCNVATVMPNLNGIVELTRNLSMTNFLVAEEKIYLRKTLEQIVSQLQIDENKGLRSVRQKIAKKITKINNMINNIENDIPIPMKDYANFVSSVKLNDKAANMLKNLAKGNKRDAMLATCLRKRVTLLKELVADQTENQLIQHYKLDRTFRVALEVLLFDILDILKDNDIVNKSKKLLTEISLRNLLTHGSPLLEVVGDALDANDLPTELVSKALVLLEDERAIVALCALIDSGFDFNKVNSDTLAPEDEASVVALKSSARWKDYLQLIPQYKQILYEERKLNRSHINDTLPELVRAVYKNDPVAVQEAIDGGAHANSIDDYKAAMHHAAAEGYARVMEVLLKNGADVDIRNEESQLTALHYAAMHGFKDAVELLLKNGADCFALDGKGRTPVYLATQGKHNEISRILLQAMKTVILANN